MTLKLGNIPEDDTTLLEEEYLLDFLLRLRPLALTQLVGDKQAIILQLLRYVNLSQRSNIRTQCCESELADDPLRVHILNTLYKQHIFQHCRLFPNNFT